jgi:hypothetical protein
MQIFLLFEYKQLVEPTCTEEALTNPLLKIVGISSPTSTRISVVADDGLHVARLVFRQGQDPLQTLTINLDACYPYSLGTFELNNLQPDVPITYAVDTAPNENALPPPDDIFQNNDQVSLRLPRENRPPRFGFLSCNGIHTLSCRQRMAMWERLATSVENGEIDHLIHGGDQIYADPILHKLSLECTVPDTESIKQMYREWYVKTWSREPIRRILASCPSVMMWDDHDIFDGWGSHDEVSPLAQITFEAAHAVFGEFQARNNPTSIDQGSYATAFVLNEVGVLMLDGRTNRSYRNMRIIGEQQWQAIDTWLDNAKTKSLRYLLVVTGVPVIHVDITAILAVQEATPWTEESTDDLRDSWIAKNNRAEARRLAMRLFQFQADTAKSSTNSTHTQVAILSGDVHVGSLGRIRSNVPAHQDKGNIPTLFQVVSSGIGYKAPSGIVAWLLRRATGGKVAITNDIYGELLPMDGVGGRVLSQRNFAIVSMADDNETTWDKYGNLYVTFHAEDSPIPLRQVCHRM